MKLMLKADFSQLLLCSEAYYVYENLNRMHAELQIVMTLIDQEQFDLGSL